MSLEEKIENIKISKYSSILEALKQMDAHQKRLLLVFDENKFVNIVTIGDLQRAIIKNFPIETNIEKVLRKNTIIATTTSSIQDIKSVMLKHRTECMPIINSSGKLKDVILWEDISEKEEKIPKRKQLRVPVVIMAGGKGTRLKPLTNVLPKALIPLGKKTMLEEIMDSFIEYGATNFYITVNYKAELIKHFICEEAKEKYNVDFIMESRYLGTAGSLHLLKNKINKTFFVSNCDIIIKNDYTDFYDYHLEQKNEITIIAALKHFSIPYGVIETKENGTLVDIIEKPELTYKINSGLYILEPHLISDIPENKFFHITDLIQNVKNRGGKVGVYPVSEKSWIDIGEWKEYLTNRYIK